MPKIKKKKLQIIPLTWDYIPKTKEKEEKKKHNKLHNKNYNLHAPSSFAFFFRTMFPVVGSIAKASMVSGRVDMWYWYVTFPFSPSSGSSAETCKENGNSDKENGIIDLKKMGF